MNLKTRREKLIYLAAFIDGEGSIGIELLSPCKVTRKGKESWQRKKDYYACRLCVINTCKPILDWIVQEFGGTLNQRKVKNTNKPCYRWHIFGSNLETLLNELEPFLFIKKRQAQCLLEYRKTVRKTGHLVSDEVLSQRRALWEECKQLNKLGI
jgi:hypothetical protein